MLRIKLSTTQLRKSTINANRITSDFFLHSGFFDYTKAVPGEKYYLNGNRVDPEGQTHKHKVSLFVPLRRGVSNPEPRFWIYGLTKIIKDNHEIFLKIIDDNLFFSDHLTGVNH